MTTADAITTVNLIVWGVLLLALLVGFLRAIRLVPTKKAYIVERLGRYRATLGPGFHALVPFLDRVAYVQDLREQTMSVPPQECFTLDNVKVHVDGVMYFSVRDPVRSSYGVTNYVFAAIQLAQTTTRSVIGTLDLDRTFEERDLISSKVVQAVNEAGQVWGIQVHRYEIKNIATPNTVRNAMEQQMTAERERRALVARSEGEKQSRINRSEGQKMELINKSEGEMQRRINEAQGMAAEIKAIADATASSIERVAQAVVVDGGDAAVRMQLTERYFDNLGNLASEGTKVVLPADLTRIDDLLGALGLRIEPPRAPAAAPARPTTARVPGE